MKTKIFALCVTLSLLGSANAEILNGVMAIKGAEMS
jgi:hypothetical protein